MLVKMALSKSIVKEIDKTELYFKKYQYKATISAEGVMYIRGCKTMERFIRLVTRRYEDWELSKDRYPNGWYRQPLALEDHDLILIEDLITLKSNLEGADVKFRHENDNLSLYTNDESLIETLAKHDFRWNFDKAVVSPQGVKYFKRQPPAKFRTYMTNNKVKGDFCQEMLEYLNRTPDITPSGAFYDWLHRRNVYGNYVWVWNNHFIDYNDERNLMMLHLMFPNAIGITYKLEKKP